MTTYQVQESGSVYITQFKHYSRVHLTTDILSTENIQVKL